MSIYTELREIHVTKFFLLWGGLGQLPFRYPPEGGLVADLLVYLAVTMIAVALALPSKPLSDPPGS